MSELNGRTLGAVRRSVTARLRSAGFDSPELDARLLVGAALQLNHTGLAVQSERTIKPGEAVVIDAFMARRLAGEPVARIIGRKEFWRHDFRVTGATLVPRPDTETVVNAALDFLRSESKSPKGILIADIGTGSGAILLSLLSELPNARGVGVDISADALEVARLNSESLNLGDRAQFVQSDYAAALSGPFDAIVSNPPYIPSRDIQHLAVEVRDYDPRLALDGGTDGLDAYRMIAPQACQLLRSGGALVVEVGHDQAVDASEILRTAGLTIQRPPAVDLGGIQRVVTGIKPAY